MEGIDIARYQEGIDLAQAASEGKEFSIVKLGGGDDDPGGYVDYLYTENVDGARANGMRVGHYWFVGPQLSPEASADFIQANVHDLQTGDVIALDNEGDGLWTDAQATTFFNQILTNFGAQQNIWMYIQASLLSNGWAQTAATGAKLWVANWGAAAGDDPLDGYGNGGFSDWSVHQYMSGGDGGIAGGVACDLDVAKESAFDGDGDGGSTSEGETIQKLARAGGYSGLVDGVPGTNTWIGLQTLLAGYGYTGPTDGDPGTNTYVALQRLAQFGGYSGAIDGEMGTNSWAGIQTILAGFGYTGPIDGDRGAGTYSALQRLAQLGGYTGPIDGDPGPATYAALATLVS